MTVKDLIELLIQAPMNKKVYLDTNNTASELQECDINWSRYSGVNIKCDHLMPEEVEDK